MMNGGNGAQKLYFPNTNNLIATCSSVFSQQQPYQMQHQLLPVQKASLAKLTTERMREYLSRKDDLDCVLEICHAKIAQKSYGQEKRFFCPPPLVYLRGKGWKWRWMLAKQSGDTMLDIQNLNPDEIGDKFPAPTAYIGIVGSKDQEKHKLEWHEKEGRDRNERCAIKALHISENDNNRRKYFTLNVNCFYETPYPSCQQLGVFESKRIKVISKPSKKKLANNKQSDIKNQGINIASGTEVALFSRVRSQTTNTRYLFVDNGKFVADPRCWGSFTIHLIDVQAGELEHLNPDADDFHVCEGFINYGSIVKLVDSVSGLALPMMRICKVEKYGGQDLVVVDERDASVSEQVSQLHKCAFQMLNKNNLFLCFATSNIVQQDPKPDQYTGPVPPEGRKPIKDGAQWTIISTDTTQYKFFESLRPAQTEIAPVPIVTSLDLHATDSSSTYVELNGNDFYPNLQAWIGSNPMQTSFVNKELIRFSLPQLERLNMMENVDYTVSVRHHHPCLSSPPHSSNLLNGNASEGPDEVYEFPLSLVREDGVIYSTQLSVAYSRTRDSRTGLPRVQAAEDF